MSQPSIPRSAAAALALSLCAASASAQVIVVGPAAGAIAQVPANGPMALALLLGALLLAAWWQLRRGPAAQRVLAWLAVVTLGVAMHSGGLLALPFNSFTNTAGETLTIPVTATTVGADFTGFQQEEFANQSGVALKVTALVPPNLGQCFTGANTADKLLQPGTPSASATPLCQVGTVLANNAACRVDVDAVCRGLLGAAPTFSHISPTSGPAAGGTLVTLTGSNLTNATGVSFGGVPGTSVTVVSAGQITAVTPAHAAGVVDVTVSTPAGMVKLAGFTYVAVPAISSVNPASGSPAGGTSVVLTGSNFTGTTAVTLGGAAATSFTVDSATQITAVTPAHATGAVDVVVTTPGGSATASNGFTYIAAPAISSINPTSGPAAGGTSVVLTGSNFTGATAVTMGGTAATSFTVVSATQITAVTPAHAAGAVNVVVTTPGGNATATGGFTYIAVPAISGVNPASGSPAGGTSVVLTGSNFTGATVVTLGGAAATSFIVDSATQITVVTPAHAAGAVDVVVTTSNGSATAVDGFTYAYAVGQPLQGGVIATMNGSVPQLIAAAADLYFQPWGASTSVLGAQSDDNGAVNTAEIVAVQGLGTVAGACQQFNAGGNSDWYLPAKNQLHDLYVNQAAIGGFTANYYWSSTEGDANTAWGEYFDDGSQYPYLKFSAQPVRCVRNYAP